MSNKIESTAKFFKDIGHPIRLKILLFIAEKERCLCEILPNFKVSQPTMSRHLAVLREHNLIKYRKEGNKILYTIADERVFKVLNSLGFNLKVKRASSFCKKEKKCQKIN